MTNYNYNMYYKIFLRSDEKFTVVCLQPYDEDDYHQDRFLTDPDSNKQVKFTDEQTAIKYLNSSIKPEFIDPNYRAIDFSKYRI